jgi:thiol-disulfide isomerase/thioredoxin
MIAALVLAWAAPSHAADSKPTDFKPSGTVKNFEIAQVAKTPPPFTWRDASGAETSLAAYAGKTVVMNFWATWCAPCITELPALERLQAKLGTAPIVLVALNIDRGDEGAEKARAMLRRLKLDGLAFHHDSDSRAYRSLGIEVMPTTIIFDPQGREAGRLRGPAEWDAPEARALIDAIK